MTKTGRMLAQGLAVLACAAVLASCGTGGGGAADGGRDLGGGDGGRDVPAEATPDAPGSDGPGRDVPDGGEPGDGGGDARRDGGDDAPRDGSAEDPGSGPGDADAGAADALDADPGVDAAADPGRDADAVAADVPGEGPRDGGDEGQRDPGTATDVGTADDAAADDAAGPGDPGPGDDGDPGPACDVPWVAPWDPDRWTGVRGWILLDRDPEAVASALEAAPAFGINQIQLSHDLIMDIDEIVGEGADVQARVDVLNGAIAMAHARGMKAYVWSHELPSGYVAVCYGPDGAVWGERAAAYRAGLARIPDVDGVVLMFGSAGTPPWFTFCDCDWCWDTWGESFDSPPQAERIRLVTEHVAAVVTGELGKELVARVFVHEPDENAWHRDGLAALPCTPFTTMHKDAVNDWEPYNPPDPTMPVAEGRPAFLETDAAGEYFGLSELPFAAPGYYRYRLAQAAGRQSIGYAARIERGSSRALGTPNEVNLWALKMLSDDPRTPLEDIWDAAFLSLYGVEPGSPAAPILRELLEPTFAIRIKSHYALGIWALEKGSDIPSAPAFGQLYQRGDMPKWDPAWEATWDSLDHPDRATVLRLYQEGTEALVMAEDSVALFEAEYTTLRGGGMAWADIDDLERRLRHQMHAAAAWRDVDLALWAGRTRSQGSADPDLPRWMAFAVADLRRQADVMDSYGLADVGIVSPARMRSFATAAEAGIPAGTVAAAPPAPLFAPLALVALGPDRATLRFRTRRTVEVTLDVGLEMPGFGRSLPLGEVTLGEDRDVEVDGLEPGRRYVARLRATSGDGEDVGGETWIFTPFP